MAIKAANAQPATLRQLVTMTRKGADVLYMIENGQTFVFEFYDGLGTFSLNRCDGLAFAALLSLQRFAPLIQRYAVILSTAAAVVFMGEIIKNIF